MTIRTVTSFLAITFSLTWGLALVFIAFPDAIVSVFGPLSMTNPLFLLAVYSPGIAAFALVLRESGFAGLGRFAGRALMWRCHVGWYVFILLGIPLLMVAVWGVWHIPAFLLSGTPQSGWSFLPYFLALMSVAMIMTAMFNASRGSLLLAILIHFQLNNPIFPDAQPYDAITFIIAALVVVWIYRKSLLGGADAVTVVVPGPSPAHHR